MTREEIITIVAAVLEEQHKHLPPRARRGIPRDAETVVDALIEHNAVVTS